MIILKSTMVEWVTFCKFIEKIDGDGDSIMKINKNDIVDVENNDVFAFHTNHDEIEINIGENDVDVINVWVENFNSLLDEYSKKLTNEYKQLTYIISILNEQLLLNKPTSHEQYLKRCIGKTVTNIEYVDVVVTDDVNDYENMLVITFNDNTHIDVSMDYDDVDFIVGYFDKNGGDVK